MKNHYKCRGVRIGMSPSGNGMWRCWAQWPDGGYEVSAELPHARAANLMEHMRSELRGYAYLPAWLAPSLYVLLGVTACSVVTLLLHQLFQ